MERPWHKYYPLGIPNTINPDEYANLPAFWDSAVKRHGPKVAFQNQIASYRQKLTYHEVDQLATQFAIYLQKATTLQPGDRIAIQLPNLLQYPVVMLGALKAGLVVVNTNPLYTSREMLHQFADSGAKALVILDMFQDKLEDILALTDIQKVIVTSVADLFPWPIRDVINAVNKYVKQAVKPVELPRAVERFRACLGTGELGSFQPVEIDSSALAFLQYTGGTTGRSKGAMLTHRNILANTLQCAAWFSVKADETGERWITALPLYHIFALTVNAFVPWSYGAENLLITNPREMANYLDACRRYDPTIMTGVNTLFNGMLNHPKFAQVPFKSLKFAVAGGMALQRSVAERWAEHGSQIVEGYGLTEASPVTHCNRLTGDGQIGSIGLPLPSTDVRLMTEDGQEVTEPGQRGELQIKGPQVMEGYWQLPAETANSLVDGGWLRTGDVATITDEHHYKIVDRMKDMILVSGFNVYPNEIEDVIASHPSVLEVACIGIPDVRSNEAVKIIVVPKPGASCDADTLREYAREHLTGYKVPKVVEVRTEPLPKSNIGKILRRELREQEPTA